VLRVQHLVTRIKASRVSVSLQGRKMREIPPESRKALEDSLLDKWQSRLVQMLLECRAPTVEGALDKALKFFTGMSRANALRNQILVLERVRANVKFLKGSCWPKDPWQLVSYMEARASGPCGQTMIPAILTAVRWFEDVGGFIEKPGEHPVVVAASQYMAMSLETEGAITKKAPRFPTAFIVGLEVVLATS
jgi:hypothetical protein